LVVGLDVPRVDATARRRAVLEARVRGARQRGPIGKLPARRGARKVAGVVARVGTRGNSRGQGPARAPRSQALGGVRGAGPDLPRAGDLDIRRGGCSERALLRVE